MDLGNIGMRVKQARQNKQMTQQELAEASGVTKSFLSKIENGHASAAIATFSKIAMSLDVPLSWFLEEDNDVKDLILVSHDKRNVRSGGSDIGYLYETLANRSRFSRIEPVVVTVDPTATDVQPFTHHESEFMYVLQGTINLYYDGVLHPMQEGDSAFFDGEKPHVFLANQDQEAKILSIFVHNNP